MLFRSERVPPERQVDLGSLALFPGSRPAELRRLWPVFRETAERMEARRIWLALAPGRSVAELGRLPAHTEVVDSATALRCAEKALSKSGTSTLELAIGGVPTVVAHRVHPLTWYLGRLLVRGVRHLALPNVLLARQEEIGVGTQAPVPEYLQQFGAEALCRGLQLVGAPPVEKLRNILDIPGDRRSVAERAAESILRPLARR